MVINEVVTYDDSCEWVVLGQPLYSVEYQTVHRYVYDENLLSSRPSVPYQTYSKINVIDSPILEFSFSQVSFALKFAVRFTIFRKAVMHIVAEIHKNSVCEHIFMNPGLRRGVGNTGKTSRFLAESCGPGLKTRLR